MYGCFGCLGITAFLVMIVVGLAGIAYVQVGSEEISSESITPDLPVSALAPDSAELSGDTTSLESPTELPGGGLRDFDQVMGVQGKVILEAAQSELQVEPGRPGEPLRLEASYDKTSYQLEEVVEVEADGTWTYRVKFERTRSGGFMTALRQLVGGARPRVRIFLPPDVLLDLEATTSQGGLELELGGLWLRTAQVEFQQGGAEIQFSQPLRAPMEQLSINGSMGGFAVIGVGKASPARLEVGFSMGGGYLDLRGPWQNDADISISASMGGAEIRLPQDLAIEGVDLETPRPPGTAELPLTTLRFDISESSRKSLEFSE